MDGREPPTTTPEHTMTHRHRHTVTFTSNSLPAFGSVATGRKANPLAHGGYRIVQTCGCGAQRDVIVNGRHEERGTWRAAEVDPDGDSMGYMRADA